MTPNAVGRETHSPSPSQAASATGATMRRKIPSIILKEPWREVYCPGSAPSPGDSSAFTRALSLLLAR